MSRSADIRRSWSGPKWVGLLVLTSLSLAAMDVRFSQTLSGADRTASGLDRLNSDQLAVLDALVRRDLTARTAPSAKPLAAEFSQRLSADERRNGGIILLKPDEVTRLDWFLDRHAAGLLARSLLAAPAFVAPASRLRPTEAKEKSGQIHGSYSLSFGWGKGGYSEKTGSIMLNYQDPAGRYSIGVGYTESHIKGPAIYRDYQDELGAYRPGTGLLLAQP